MMLTCYSTSAANASDVRQLYDFNNDVGSLWARGSPGDPLPLCSASSPPPDSRCLVCLDEMVFAVCRNLTRGVNVAMEGQANINISENDCPSLLSGDGNLGASGITVIVLCILFVILFVIVIVRAVFKRRKRSNQRHETIPQDLMLDRA